LVPVVTLPEGTTVDTPGTADAVDRAFGILAADPRLRAPPWPAPPAARPRGSGTPAAAPRLRVLAWPATAGARRLVADGGHTLYGLVWGPFQGQDGADPALAGTLADGLRRVLPPGTGVQVTGLDALRTAASEEPAGTGVLVETL